MATQVFVSPGVYTSEKDLSFVTRQVGVTTLGSVGETSKGPAFQPIFISNYDEFTSFFGGLNAEKVKENYSMRYELPYIAKSYLSQSNQLFVTRVLGFSGYDAGEAWGITLDAAMDTSTVVTTAGPSAFTVTYTASITASTFSSFVSSDAGVQALYDGGFIDSDVAFLINASTGATATVAATYYKITETGSGFAGSAFNLYVDAEANVGDVQTGTTTGLTTTFSASSYTDVENQVVALLRSRGSYDGNEILGFEVTGSTLGIASTASTAQSSPLAAFQLTGTSTTQGAFNYAVSFDKTKKNYIKKVLGCGAQDNKTAVFVEEIFQNMFDGYITDSKVRGINLTPIEYAKKYDDYILEYQPAKTPYLVSEVRGNKVLQLFRFVTISDGNVANKEFKMSIANIKPDSKEFDVIIRSYADTDANPVVLEKFSKCTMDPTSNGYLGKKVGTLDGEYPSKSKYVLIEFDEENDTTDAFPAGFLGYPVRDYDENGNTGVQAPTLTYKETYGEFEKKRKFYLGLSNTKGIDQDFFDYKGVADSNDFTNWTATTNGFHMDIDASGVTIDGVTANVTFDTGNANFQKNNDLDGTDYEKIYSRKFTLAPFGGFDGWDIYRTRKTNTDKYLINGSKGQLGLTSGTFANRALTNGDIGINSDYYAFLEGIWTFKNPEAININVFTTPGIDMVDNTNLVDEAIEMIEQDRADSLYIATLPDVDGGGDVITSEEAAANIEDMFDSNYTATYFPWIQINDAENNQYVWVPPTRDVVRNIALTDNIAFPWFAVAGIQRGDVDAIQARVKLTQADRDELYEGRVNPVTTWASDGIKIWGNKTLQVKESALDRINVRRLLLQSRKLISAVSLRLLFEQNDDIVRNQFLSLVNPILDNIRSERGLTDFRVVLDDDPEARDRNELCGRIFIKPTRALEFICVEFNILNTGASFDDV